MTTTTQPQPSASEAVPHDRDDALDPYDAFTQPVEDEPDVCNSCFSVIRRDHRKRGAGTHGHDEVAHDQFGEVTVRDGGPMDPVITVEPEDVYGELCTYPERTVCGHCGAISGRAPDETRSRRKALELVPRLAQRIREHGIRVNETAMRAMVREAKSREAISSMDAEIYRRAVALGIRFGGGLSEA
jgi:hypothetical protein